MEFVYSPVEDKTEKATNGKNNNASSHLEQLSDSGAVETRRKRKSTTKALQIQEEQQSRRKRSKPSKQDSKKSSFKNSADHYMVRVNWLYRPKDISKRTSDSRVLYATMNSDICPLASIRGRCNVTHRDHIKDIEEYRCKPDNFYFDKLYDRYIIRFFDVVPTEKIINIPAEAQEVLCRRFKYAVVEIGRGKELCAAPKNCEKCTQWCSPDDSIQCAHCHKYYHMLCVDPPLERKPSRGFGWSCAICSNDRERRIQEQRGLTLGLDPSTPNLISSISSKDSSSTSSEITTSTEALNNGSSISHEPSKKQPSTDQTKATTNGISSLPTKELSPTPPPMTRFEQLKAAFTDDTKSEDITDEQHRQLKLWPFRYLGVHAKIEDVLDMDDRIYPRAASRLGQKHQAQVPDWPGRAVLYYDVDSSDRKSKKSKGSQKKQASTSEESKVKLVGSRAENELKTLPEGIGSLEELIKPKNRPPWLQQKPAGYQERGGDETSTLLWERPNSESSDDEVKQHDKETEDYLEQAKPFAEKIGVPYYTPNFIDACLKAFLGCKRDSEAALKVVATFTKKSLKEPILTDGEKKKFAEGVKIYGSELHDVHKYVGSVSSADIVRYYYLWKKTPEGHRIWDNYEGRKRNRLKALAKKQGGLVDEVADSADDSAYDNDKSTKLKRTYICKYCKSTHSLAWRRAPGQSVANETNPINALCIRCARLWRRYAVIWEDPNEVLRKSSQRGSNHWKRKMEVELYEDAKLILEERDKATANGSKSKKQKTGQGSSSSTPASSNGTPPIDTTSSSSSNTAKSRKTKPVKGSKPKAEAKVSKSQSQQNFYSDDDLDSLSSLSSPSSSGSLSLILDSPADEFSSDFLLNDDKRSKMSSTSSNYQSDTLGKLSEGKEVKSETSQDPTIGTNPTKDMELSRKDYKLEILKEIEREKMVRRQRKSNSSRHTDGDSEMKDSPASKKLKSQTSVLSSALNTITQARSDKSSDSGSSTRVCSVCNQNNILRQVTCDNCGLRVHNSCYGIPEKASVPSDWLCDACENEQDPYVSTFYSCILCPVRDLATQPELTAAASTNGQEGKSNLKPCICPDALKPTYDNLWAHVKCAIWVPEITFDSLKLKPIQGVNNVGSRFKTKCSLCGTTNGACVECGHCGKQFHVGCADKEGYFRGMEVVPTSDLKPSEIETTLPGEVFCSLNGQKVRIKPVILCKETTLTQHHVNLSTICSETKKSVLQIYVESRKIRPSKHTGAIKRSKLYSVSKDSSQVSTKSELSSTTSKNGIEPSVVSNGLDDILRKMNSKLSEATKDLAAINAKFGINNRQIPSTPFNLMRQIPPPSFNKETSSAIKSLIEMDKKAEIERARPLGYDSRQRHQSNFEYNENDQGNGYSQYYQNHRGYRSNASSQMDSSINRGYHYQNGRRSPPLPPPNNLPPPGLDRYGVPYQPSGNSAYQRHNSGYDNSYIQQPVNSENPSSDSRNSSTHQRQDLQFPGSNEYGQYSDQSSNSFNELRDGTRPNSQQQPYYTENSNYAQGQFNQQYDYSRGPNSRQQQYPIPQNQYNGNQVQHYDQRGRANYDGETLASQRRSSSPNEYRNGYYEGSYIPSRTGSSSSSSKNNNNRGSLYMNRSNSEYSSKGQPPHVSSYHNTQNQAHQSRFPVSSHGTNYNTGGHSNKIMGQGTDRPILPPIPMNPSSSSSTSPKQ